MSGFIISIFLSLMLGADFNCSIINENYNKPIFLESYPGSQDTLIVVEQSGMIWVMINGKKRTEEFLNIKDKVHNPLFPGDERGLLGFALHPNYKNNLTFYINYINKNGESIISQFHSHSQLKGNPFSESKLFIIKQPYSNHNGGHLEFGPDEYLYIALGDGGSAGDPHNNAQNLTNFFGKILRIDVHPLDNSNLYSIPHDNPFYNSNDYKKEIWSYGLRNPWRFSFDRLTGDMFIADVGQNNWEEINFEGHNSGGGINYGWNFIEGKHCYLKEDCELEKFQVPVFEYSNNANYIKTLAGFSQKNVFGCSITGGYIYRKNKTSSFYGSYFFADYCTGNIWSFKLLNNKITDFNNHSIELKNIINDKNISIASFGEDDYGNIYVIDYGGKIIKLQLD